MLNFICWDWIIGAHINSCFTVKFISCIPHVCILFILYDMQTAEIKFFEIEKKIENKNTMSPC